MNTAKRCAWTLRLCRRFWTRILTRRWKLPSRNVTIYTKEAQDLTVEWVKKGDAFLIDEYDGSESLHVIGDNNYLVA